MRNTRIAEFLLERFTTREHAAAIVGDLIEIAPAPIRFWLAVAHTLARFAARPLAGVLAGAASAWLLRALYVANFKSYPRPSEIDTLFVMAGLLLGMISGCSAVRRGPLDSVTTLAAALCALASAADLLRLHTAAFIGCGVAFELLLLGSLAVIRTRPAALRILAAGACGVAGAYTAWHVIPFSLAHSHPLWYAAIQVLAPNVAIGVAVSWSRRSPAPVPE